MQQSSYILNQLYYIAVLALMQHCSNGALLTADDAAMQYVKNGHALAYASMHAG